MFVRRTMATAFLSLILVTLSGISALSAPMPIPGSGGLASWDFGVFNDRAFQLFLFSSGVADPVPPGTNIFVNDFKPPLSPWEINLDISIQHLADPATGAALGDRVAIFAEVFHSRHPLPEPAGGPGDTYTATFLFDFLPRVPVVGVIPSAGPSILTDMRFKTHNNHRDLYTAMVSMPGFRGKQITSWNATLTGEHQPQAAPLPEPSVFTLFAIGVLAVIGLGYWKRWGLVLNRAYMC